MSHDLLLQMAYLHWQIRKNALDTNLKCLYLLKKFLLSDVFILQIVTFFIMIQLIW